MGEVKKIYREAKNKVREAGREFDGHSVNDDVGNAGDDARDRIANAGDEARKGARDARRDAELHRRGH